MEGNWLAGKITSTQKGFGFITPREPLPHGFKGGKVFFRFFMVQGPRISEGDEILFQLNVNKTDKPAAKAVKRADWNGEHSRSRSATRAQPNASGSSTEAWPKRAHSAVRTPNKYASSSDETLRTRRNSVSGAKGPAQNKPFENISKQTNSQEKKQAPRQERDFKSRILGRVATVDEDKNFGFLQPLEELPMGYPANKRVYFQYKSVENGGLDLEVNDILSFTLGTRDKNKPRAMCVNVEQFHPNRSSDQLEDYVESIKQCCDHEDIHMYKYVSCDAAWKCLGDSKSMSEATALMLIRVLLTLQEKLRSLHHRYVHIIQVISKSYFFNVWCGTLKKVIENEHKLKHIENIEFVKDFLLVVLRAVPEKLSAITRLLKPLLTKDTSSMEYYLYNMLRESTRNIPTDVEDMPWENLPLVPSGKELLMEGTATLQPVRMEGAYDSVEQYMDVYFRLFREDCFSALKKGIQSLLNGSLDLRDMNVYHSVKLVGLHLTREDSGLAIALQVVPLRPVKNWASSSNLMFGNLLCLSVSGSFRDSIWATVSNRDVKLLSSKNIIIIELCTESNDMSDSDAIILLSHGSGKIIIAESPTYYRAYQPVLKALQKIQPEDFPFMSQLVEVDNTVKPPVYFRKSTTADTRILHQTEGKAEEVLIDVIRKHPELSVLDSSQYHSLCMAMFRRVAIIQGPPGTGKTFIGIKLIELILSMSTAPQKPVLVLTYKNHALDEFMKDMMNRFPGDVARIGGRCKEASLQKCNLSTLKRDTKKSRELNRLISVKYRQADEAKPDVKRQAIALDAACHYSHSILFQYATTHQVISLLVGCSWKESHMNLQPPITLRIVQRYIEAALSYDPDICMFMQTEYRNGEAQLLQRMLFALIQAAMQQWYPPQATVHQVETTLGLVTDLDLSRPMELLKEESKHDLQLQDEKDIEDMEKERLAAMSAMSAKSTQLKKDDVIEFRGLSKTNHVPRLFSTSRAFLAQLPQARLMNIMDLWELGDFDRVKYIQCLLLKNFDAPKQALEEALSEYQQVSAARNELHVQHSIEVLEDKKVIGMTITGASIHRSILSALQPAIVIVEEAAEVLEPQLIAALSKSVQHLILIGDHQQLRPPVESYELTKDFHFDVSMMERLIKNKLPYYTLRKQNRMRPEFSRLLLDIYPELEDNTERVLKNHAPICMEKSMYFWTHCNPEKGGRSYWNDEEADRAIRLCLFFLQQGYEPRQVTILSGYQGQTSLIRQKMREEEKAHSELFPMEPSDEPNESGQFEMKPQRVQIHTIDLYQGDENDIVIVSLVRSNERNNTGFLKIMNRRCVAQSRSKCGLYFIGDVSTIGTVGHWKKLIENMDKENCVGPVITLKCPRHPNTTQRAARPSDITLSSFCAVICDEMEACGIHQCKKTCQPSHSHDRCLVPVAFHFEECGHVCQKPCTKPAEHMVCKKPCTKLMDCGIHPCTNICGRSHEHSYCAERIEFTYTKCGHTNTKHCSQEEDIRCEVDVTFNHPVCDHLLKKQCFEDPSDVKCKQQCIKQLSCGHQCGSTCGAPCTKPENCKSCEKIKKEEEKKRLEAERKAIAEYKKKLREELAELKEKPVGDVLQTDLDPDGDNASEYYEVEDRVKKYVQLKHKWFPEVTKIEKIHNPKSHMKYLEEADRLQDPMHRVLLFHGTSAESAKNIIAHGFNVPKTGGMFGRGIYFATDSSKSAQEMYTKGSNLLLLCEVNLGKCKTVERDRSDMDSIMLQHLGYDSLYAKRDTRAKGGVMFDEYVVYRPTQAIVKYVVHYQCTSIPAEHLDAFEFFGKEKKFSKHVLCAKRGRHLQDSYDTHYRIAESQFLRLTKERKLPLSLTEVHYFVNPPLVEKFKSKYQEFQAKYGKQAPESEFIPVWHGTKEGNIDKIVQENFRLEKLASATGDRGWYGAGIYFSDFLDVSLSYGSKVLLCMVLPGQPFDATTGDRPKLEGKPCKAGYDSHRIGADTKGRGVELVIFNPDQILPCYVINYKRD